MRVLLVGGFGFVGAHLIKVLGGSHDLIVFSSQKGLEKTSSFRWAREPIVEVGDVTDGDRVKEAILRHHPEAVIHLAAVTGVKRCNENVPFAFSVNVLGTYNVVMGCVEGKCRLIFFSSREVYGETLYDRTRENDPLVPNNVYGVTKMLGERLVRWASSRYNLDYTILRLTNVYGPGGDQYNVQAIIKKALVERKVRILGGSQTMDLIYVEDVAEVTRRCLDDPRASRQIFNVGSGHDMSVEEIVSTVISVLDIPVKIERGPMRVGETLKFRSDIELLEKKLGYIPATTLENGLRKTMEWYMQDSLHDNCSCVKKEA